MKTFSGHTYKSELEWTELLPTLFSEVTYIYLDILTLSCITTE